MLRGRLRRRVRPRRRPLSRAGGGRAAAAAARTMQLARAMRRRRSKRRRSGGRSARRGAGRRSLARGAAQQRRPSSRACSPRRAWWSMWSRRRAHHGEATAATVLRGASRLSSRSLQSRLCRSEERMRWLEARRPSRAASSGLESRPLCHQQPAGGRAARASNECPSRSPTEPIDGRRVLGGAGSRLYAGTGLGTSLFVLCSASPAEVSEPSQFSRSQ